MKTVSPLRGIEAVLFHNTPVPMVLTRLPERRLALVNEAFQKVTGYSPAEVIGKTSLELNLFLNPEQHRATAGRLQAEGSIKHQELQIRCRDGSIIDGLFSGEAVNIQGENYLITVMLDITERKKFEAALVNSEEKHRRLFETMSQGVVYQALDGSIISANPAAERILGLAFEQMLKMSSADPFRRMIREDGTEVPGMEHPAMAAVRTGRKVGPVIRGVFHPGQNGHIWLSITATPLFPPGENRPFQVYSVFEDITKKKQTEEALAEERRRLEYILEATRTRIDILDADYNILSVDKTWEKIYGPPQGRKCHDYFMGRDRPCPGCGVTEALKTGNVVVSEEFLPRENRHIEVHTIPFQNDRNEWRVAEFNLDITDRKQAEADRQKLQEQFNQARKMESIGRLAGGVAHEFNNMLNVILGFTELAQALPDLPEKLRGYLRQISEAGAHSAEVTRQLTGFARKQTIAPRVLDLNEVVAGMVKILRHLVGEEIFLDWRPCENPWPVKIDPTQINQILANLCVNSRDAISGRGRIIITTEMVSLAEVDCVGNLGFIPAGQAGFVAGDFFLLSVRDNGCGMDQATLDNLFEPFFTTKEVGHGTGLGLSMVYGIVSQNDGFIAVDSEPGQGTGFKIYLPRRALDG